MQQTDAQTGTATQGDRPSSLEFAMIDHVSIGVSNILRSKTFYDAALHALGYACLSEDKTSLGYGKDRVELWVNIAERPTKPDRESGLHFCFEAPTRQSVDAFHKAAQVAGGQNNGEPGLRGDYGPDYYAAYVVDPDGYRIEAYCSRAA